MADKAQILANMSTRQKAIAGLMVVIVLIIIWQLIGLFGGGKKTVTTPTNKAMPTVKTPTMTNTPTAGAMSPSPAGGSMQLQQMTPQPAQLTQTPTAGVTQREAELIKMQEETQAKYIAALNELQMLKVARDIAEANQAIMTAKLATVASEKKIIDMLSPIAGGVGTPAGYAKNLVSPVPAGAPPAPGISQLEASYTVISVSQLQYKWSAVLGHKGSLYNVHVGDILPQDNSKVVNIDKSGVELEKDGVKTKISLVPII